MQIQLLQEKASKVKEEKKAFEAKEEAKAYDPVRIILL